MTVYYLPVFDIGGISTDNPAGFNGNGGYQFNLGVDTVAINSAASPQVVAITDWVDNTFDDDQGAGQVLSGAQTINNTAYADGTIIEAEYVLEVQDSLGNSYGLQFISLNNDAFTIQGFAVYGPMPPLDVPLTVVANYDAVSGYIPYPVAAAPPCFGPGTRIDTADGPVPVERLRTGALLVLANGALAPLRLVLSSPSWTAGPDRASPVRIAPGALGAGRPLRELILSP